MDATADSHPADRESQAQCGSTLPEKALNLFPGFRLG